MIYAYKKFIRFHAARMALSFKFRIPNYLRGNAYYLIYVLATERYEIAYPISTCGAIALRATKNGKR